MTNDDVNEIHQAVFGYSNGHRLLASTVQLGSIDVYELAAASDLAPGAKLSLSESYLTGVMLPESKMYALIRTWLAPEMQRPGCVWSHVLLLSRNVLSSQIDLGALNDLFSRPANYETDLSFSAPLSVGRRARSVAAPIELIEQLLLACYKKMPLARDSHSQSEFESAILAVWSQQWPRLRSGFLFRSIQSTTEMPCQMIVLGDEPSKPIAKREAWLKEAASDAISPAITPLRRFLWRYGKDIKLAESPFVDLVNVYLNTRGTKPSYDDAVDILNRLSHGQAQTLKSDLLGFSPNKQALIESVSIPDLIRLLAAKLPDDFEFDKAEFAGFFAKADAASLPAIASGLTRFRDQLGGLDNLIFSAILPLVKQETLTQQETPPSFVLSVLQHRPELIAEKTVSRLSTDDLGELIGEALPTEASRIVLRGIFQNPARPSVHNVAEKFPLDAFETAIDLSLNSKLHDDWQREFRQNSGRFVTLVPQLRGANNLFGALLLLDFPIEPPNGIEIWVDAFAVERSGLDTDVETTFLTYLATLCISQGLEGSKEIAIAVLPSLRRRLLNGALSSGDERLLAKFLPHHSDAWDYNKRLLKLIRRTYKQGGNLDALVASLDLSDDEYAYATNQDPENVVRTMMRAFMPWGWRD